MSGPPQLLPPPLLRLLLTPLCMGNLLIKN